MQIHEVARRKVNEGILKGVANNVGTTVKGMGQGLGMAAKGVAKAGLNTAEYFANKVLNAAGVPQDQQGSYSKYGHMAAGQQQGTASIAKAEHEIANELAKEWANTGTLNGTKSETLNPESIKQAALAFNAGTFKLEINADNIVNKVQTLAPQYVKDIEQQQIATAKRQIAAKNLMAELEKQYALSKDTTQPIANKQQAIVAKNKVIGLLAKLGYNVEQKYLDDTVASAQNAVVQSAGAPLLTATPVAKQAPAAPAAPAAGFNFNNVMKMQGMNPTVKKPVTAPTTVKKPELEPAIAESLTWSKNFDPSKQLYRRMKQGQSK